jgi:hypothetical protein
MSSEFRGHTLSLVKLGRSVPVTGACSESKFAEISKASPEHLVGHQLRRVLHRRRHVHRRQVGLGRRPPCESKGSIAIQLFANLSPANSPNRPEATAAIPSAPEANVRRLAFSPGTPTLPPIADHCMSQPAGGKVTRSRRQRVTGLANGAINRPRSRSFLLIRTSARRQSALTSLSNRPKCT